MRIEQARRVVPACLLFVSGGILFAGSFSVLPPAAISPVVFSFLSPMGYFLSIAKESHPPEAIEEKTTGKICRLRQKEKRLRGKDTAGERSTKFRKKGLTFLSYLL